MVAEFRMPALGADMDAGTVVEWRIAPGSRVQRGDVAAVVETDKGAIDVEIFMDGVVREIVVAPGTRVPIGTVLALLDTEGPAAAANIAPVPDGRLPPQPGPAAAPSADRLKVSPAARRRARELDVAVAQLQGTGPGGSVTVEDVERGTPGSACGRGGAGRRHAGRDRSGDVAFEARDPALLPRDHGGRHRDRRVARGPQCIGAGHATAAVRRADRESRCARLP
jgi:pyruvate dehydrogenase E2 component (dihydrolipoamide acetyltransferase)